MFLAKYNKSLIAISITYITILSITTHFTASILGTWPPPIKWGSTLTPFIYTAIYLSSIPTAIYPKYLKYTRIQVIRNFIRLYYY